MKLLVLLFMFDANADAFRERVFSQNQALWRMAARKCGYTARNMNKLRSKIVKDKDSVKQDCIESKLTEAQADLDKGDSGAREAIYNNARARLRCSDFAGKHRDLCIVAKGK